MRTMRQEAMKFYLPVKILLFIICAFEKNTKGLSLHRSDKEFPQFFIDEDYSLDRLGDSIARNYRPNKPIKRNVVTKKVHSCEAPENTNIDIRKSNRVVGFKLVDISAECSLRKVPVRIPAPHGSHPFLSHTMLHRCMGGPKTSPTLRHCTVLAKEQITVQYIDTVSFQIKDATMYDHTKMPIFLHYNQRPVQS
ncbi:uncharacterized protein LOC114575327 [Exaiptasia diaphana]|uniref:Uncharacterized protein n=1 Tax=Exaiptasia diaphana TaxID=2652724 RepID=A0A913YK41_EXADI|nr:uncharacterized protein LOC114575327 [Exaiptasia diaphana]